MEKRNTFKGSLGFVLAAAGSAVGLGNIWRFPYLAAQGGGGLFLVIYIVLALTFGFALLTTEIAIGRKTKQSSLTAYTVLKKGWKPLGVIGCLVPMIIMPYYAAIGGWVVKYLVVFLTGHGKEAAEEGYFSNFISGTTEPIIYMLIFLGICAVIIFLGVNKGIESSSKIIMPALIVLVLIISVFALTISHTDADGTTRTGLQGLKIYLIPSLEGIGFKEFLLVVMSAMGQLFFSLSIAMGIMVAYGSYVHDDANLVTSINQIEIFDTVVAFFAGVMVIPAVYAFMGTEGLKSSGPGLMFISLPKVFANMGTIGNVVGALFFAMVLFAALTSGVSILEAVVSSIMDQFHTTRLKADAVECTIALVGAILVCLGYNHLYFNITLPNGSSAQLLDVLDYISNNILMPIGAIGTCILIGWVVKPKTVVDEVTKNGESFGRRHLYTVMIRYIAPVMLFILLLDASGLLDRIVTLVKQWF